MLRNEIKTEENVTMLKHVLNERTPVLHRMKEKLEELKMVNRQRPLTAVEILEAKKLQRQIKNHSKVIGLIRTQIANFHKENERQPSERTNVSITLIGSLWVMEEAQKGDILMVDHIDHIISMINERKLHLTNPICLTEEYLRKLWNSFDYMPITEAVKHKLFT